MNNDELLLAISSMLDVKLAAGLKPIENRLDSIENRLDSMENRLDSMENRLDSMENRIGNMENRIGSMANDITMLKLFNENVTLVRLNTIESCYVDTYKRYKDYGDKMDAVIMDTELLKKVVTNHSKELQKLA